ncbi:MAG TPA: TIGR04283 family arsenosugar biosynthesis glycosyltransferase [Thermoanaerobaculia bacterium]|nr:TIGR04283 family arsenosugar biosynthesis glycosyltransferase [Thermoanaerobaculia bacterium]
MTDARERVPVLVFAKPPRAGEAKTRLAASLGAEGAAELARAFFQDTWAAVSSLPWAAPILATTEPDAPEWRELGVRRAWAQGDGDLGARMTRMLQRALATAPAAFAIGTDSPGLPTEHLEAARQALESADAVLGPSDDGGFYLLGLRGMSDDLLEGLPWSSGETFERTRDRLIERGLSVHVLPAWFDVDRPEDLDALSRRLVRGEIRPSATARALGRLVGTPPRVSVVIPVLDEEARIEHQLRSLVESGPWHEVLVVDGGSSDRTVEKARSVGGVRVLGSARGRALQMNAGAREATGDAFLFLHADVELPSDALRYVAGALAEPEVVAGAFRTFTVSDGRGGVFAPLLHLADLRSRTTGLPYGDQALFVRAAVFHRLGGFPEQPLMEDLAFSRSLRRAGTIRTVPASVRVSGRRFMARPIHTFVVMNAFPLLYALGVSPARLARMYGNPR